MRDSCANWMKVASSIGSTRRNAEQAAEKASYAPLCSIASPQLAYSIWPMAHGFHLFHLYAICHHPYANYRLASEIFLSSLQREFFMSLLTEISASSYEFRIWC